MTSATDELRKLLDERGVETYYEQNYITWRDANDYQCFAFETYERPGLLRVHCNLTSEQAIAATLGSEREAKLIQAIEDVLRHSTDTVWAGEAETLVDRMVALGVYGQDVYKGARPWEVKL